MSTTSSLKHEETHPFWTKEHWVHFADLEYHGVHTPSMFNVAGKEFTSSEFFQNEGSHSQSFTCLDGQRYRWDFRDRHFVVRTPLKPICSEKLTVLTSSPEPPTLRPSPSSSPPHLYSYPNGERYLRRSLSIQREKPSSTSSSSPSCTSNYGSENLGMRCQSEHGLAVWRRASGRRGRMIQGGRARRGPHRGSHR